MFYFGKYNTGEEHGNLLSGIPGIYTLLHKKGNLSEPIFASDPGSLTPTPDHVHFVKWF